MGINEIRDLLDNDKSHKDSLCMALDNEQNFLSYNAFTDKYRIKTNYLEYYKVISALAHYKKGHFVVYHNPPPKDLAVNPLSHAKVSK